MKKVSFEKFCEFTGLIDDPKVLKKIIKDDSIFQELLKEADNLDYLSWMACHDSLDLLKKVCRLYPQLYIASQVDSDTGRKVIYENCIRIVNRNQYFLCTKGQDLELYSVV